MTQGTNNGGGPRWATMPRACCPWCGLVKPVGVMQVQRNGGRCNNRKKCDERRRRRRVT
jgi:hypothetical protein